MSADAHAFVTTRRLAAPRDRVWAALENPALLAQWWGPAGFTNTFDVFEFRPGGVWRFSMHSPDGTTLPMDHRFLEITPPGRLVVRHLQPGHDFTLTITLAEEAGGTAIHWYHCFDDPAEAARVGPYVIPANEQNLDRLAALLAKTMSGTGTPVR